MLGGLAAFATSASASPPVYTATVQSGLGSPGTPDPNVQASSDNSTWGQAYNDAFAASFTYYFVAPGSSWDSITPDGYADPGNHYYYYYRTSIVLPTNAVNPTLSGQFTADDLGTAFVNGNQAGQSTYWKDGFPLSAPLTAGSNTLSFTVTNDLVTGVFVRVQSHGG